MHSRLWPTLLCLPLALAALPASSATLDRTVTVQASMRTSGGAPANATYSMEFRLFSAPTGGTAIHSETKNGVVVTDGVFDVELGPLPSTVENYGALYLEAVVAGTTLPRMPVRAVPYALVAEKANTALDVACTGCVGAGELAGNAVVPSNVAPGTYGINVSGNASTATTAAAAVSLTTPLAGDVTGSQGATSVDRVRGVAVSSSAPADGQVLRYNAGASAWQPTTPVASGGSVTSVNTAAGLTGGPITSSGTVGLRLSSSGGLVSNLGAATNELGIGAGGVVPSMVSGGSYGISVTGSAGSAASFTGALAGDVTGGQSATAVTKLRGVPVATTSPANDQFLRYDSASGAWQPETVSVGSGTVTSVATGAGLTGGTITTSGTLGLRLSASGGLSSTLGGGSNELGIAPGAIAPTMVGGGTYGISISGNAATASSATSAGTAGSFTGALAGDVTGGQGSTTVARIRGSNVSTSSPSNGQVLKYNGSEWAPAADLTGSGVTSVGASSPITSSGGSSPVIGLGIVPIGNGGTGITYGPSGAGQYLRSNGSGSWAIAPMQGSDLPTDSNSYIRNQTGQIQSGGFRVNGEAVVGRLTFGDGNAGPGGASLLNGDQGGSIELGALVSSGLTPYIDFHYGSGSNQDYNARIINSANRTLQMDAPGGVQLNVVGGTTTGDLTVTGNTYLFSGNGGWQCVMSGSCPTGWSNFGLIGVIYPYGNGSCGNMGFPQGGDFNGGWQWCHPYLCCR